MDMTPVSSSQIHSLGYDADARKLRVRFLKNGAPGVTWEYDDVPQAEFDALSSAASVGRYFGQQIKNQYTGRQV